ncbi:TPA: pectate lyase [Klebsiella aerogenes]|nr:pectate lyase [Klebsiella aerogenes]
MSALTLTITLPSLSGGLAQTGNMPESPKSTEGQSDPHAIEQLAQMLGQLFQPLLGPQADNGASGPYSNGSEPLSGIGRPEQNGVTGTSPQNASSQQIGMMGNNGLDQSLTPDGQGGGHISDNPLLKALLKLIAQMMDGQNGQFGQPNAGSHRTGDGNPSPTAGGSSPMNTQSPSFSADSPSAASPSSPTQGTAGPSPIGDRSDPQGSHGIGAGQAVDFPTASDKPTVLNDTIIVKAGQQFDGKGQTFTAGPNLGDGGQSENQKPLFKLEDGASLKNVTIGNNGADGIHLYGDAKIDNLHVTNVGEDAITVKPNSEGKKSHVEITNSSFANAADKILQLNADTSLTVDNVKAKDFGTFVRTNGGQQGNWDLNLNNISAQNGKFSFVKSDSEGLNVNTSNISLDNVNHHYKVPASAKLQVAES